MKKEITLKEMQRDLSFIEKNIGKISTRRMMTLYHKYLYGANSYFIGAELNGQVLAIKRKHIPLHWCSCQTDNNTNTQYLRFRPHKKGAIELSKSRGVFTLGNTKEIYTLYKCNTKQGYNSGYCFEIALYNFFSIDGWKQDNKSSRKGGDIRINNEEIQAKFAEKNSLATITNTDKIINEIKRRMKECTKHSFFRPAARIKVNYF